jgi:hypothetical protein
MSTYHSVGEYQVFNWEGSYWAAKQMRNSMDWIILKGTISLLWKLIHSSDNCTHMCLFPHGPHVE